MKGLMKLPEYIIRNECAKLQTIERKIRGFQEQFNPQRGEFDASMHTKLSMAREIIHESIVEFAKQYGLNLV